MFEDSLVESEGRIRTRSRWCAIGSFLLQAALLLLLILFPLFHPQALPKQSLERLLIAPPPPRAPAPVEVRRTSPPASRSQLATLEAQLQAPSRIPSRISDDYRRGARAFVSDWRSRLWAGPAGLPGGLDIGASAPPVTLARPAGAEAPVGNLFRGCGRTAAQANSAIYPAIAKAARVQGTVLLAATISRRGTIENLRVVEGPPMLRQAAIDAVSTAQYRPFLLMASRLR